MSEKYGKVKSSRRSKEDSKSHKNKNCMKEYNKYEIEGRTPPLPKNKDTLKDLMKQRESLKEELKKLQDRSEKNTKCYKRKHSTDDTKNSKISKMITDTNAKKSIRSKISPDYYADKDLDSEDEESIIEQRRMRRKQLLEKLNVADSSLQKDITKENIEITVPENVKNNFVINNHQDTIKTLQINDMFSEKDDFVLQKNSGAIDLKDENNANLKDNWDDAEGYLNIKIGETIKNKYILKKILGKGVFANVIHATDNSQNNASVAIKCVRNNDLMYRTSLKEIMMLKEINGADPENKYHCVQYITDFLYKGHLCIVLEALHMDLRSVLKKYGKNQGLHMKAIVSYSRQLLMALRLLKKLGIVHSDIKPDNILVNEKKNVLKLCDFGSASKIGDNEPTPYLVSRFYRAPEIIIGIQYSHGIDIWSAACTLYELATGRILFVGSSNNRMLKCFMDLKGKMPVKMLRKGKFKDQHFNYNNNFLLHKTDEDSGREKVVEYTSHNVTRNLTKELLKSCKSKNPHELKKINHLKDLLEKMLMLDPSLRLTVNDCLRHSFIQQDLEQI